MHPHELKLRPPQSGDELCIGVLAMQVFLDTYATAGLRPDLAREALGQYAPEVYASRLRDADLRFVLAEADDHLVGFAEVALNSTPPSGDQPAPEIVRLYVQRPFLRAGVGRRLLAAAEGLARNHGADALWLTVWSGNERARAFYAAMGFEDRGATAYVIEGQSYENRVLRRSVGRRSR